MTIKNLHVSWTCHTQEAPEVTIDVEDLKSAVTDENMISLMDVSPEALITTMVYWIERGVYFTQPVLLEKSFEGYTILEHQILNGWMGVDPAKVRTEIVHPKSKITTTYAHVMASGGYMFDDLAIQILREPEGGITVLHRMVANGALVEDCELQKLADNKGDTIAHMMARNGYVFTDPLVLMLANNHDLTVYDIAVSFRKRQRSNA